MEGFYLNPEAAYNLSVIVPVYNSSEGLAELSERIGNTLKDYSFELIMVDDHSTDQSWQVIESLHPLFPLVKLRHQKNRGQSIALRTGIRHARGRLLVTIDDDLQYQPENIIDLADAQQRTNADLVYGIPTVYHQPYYRKIISKVLGAGKQGSSFRIFTAAIGQKILQDRDDDILLDVQLRRFATHVYRIMIPHKQRKYGRSSYRFSRLVKLFINSIIYKLAAKT